MKKNKRLLSNPQTSPEKHTEDNASAEPTVPTPSKDADDGETSSKQSKKPGTKSDILLVMSDEKLSNILFTSLSSDFRITLLQDSTQLLTAAAALNPETIIIDETVNGIGGDELCTRLKTNSVFNVIPVILLISSYDSESYLFHTACGANRLELRSVDVCKFKADVSMLIYNYVQRQKQVKQLLEQNAFTSRIANLIKDEKDEDFINRLNNILETNFSTPNFTINQLSSIMGMSRSNFFKKIKRITKMSPEEYIIAFKIERAKELLVTSHLNVTEISSSLGFCDSKYFGRRFKDCCGVSPTQYAKIQLGKNNC